MKIKKWIAVGLILLSPVLCFGASTDYKVTNDGEIYSYDLITKGPWIDARAYTTLELANTAAYNAGKTLLISSDWTLTANTTLTAAVKVIKGGSFTKASTYTLTVNGSFEAGLYQVFSGFDAGDVTFGEGAVKKVYPDWWETNTTPGTTSMSVAINSAYSAAKDNVGKIVFLVHRYLYDSTTAIQLTQSYMTFEGLGTAISDPTTDGARAEIYKSTDGDLFQFTGSRKSIIFKNIALIGNQPTTTTGSAFEGASYSPQSFILDNVVIEKFPEYAIEVLGGLFWSITNSRFYGNLTGAIKTTGAINVVTIKDSRFEYNEGDWVIELATGAGLASQDWNLINCTFHGNHGNTLSFTRVEYSKIQSCHFEGNNSDDNADSKDIYLVSCRSIEIGPAIVGGSTHIHTGIVISSSNECILKSIGFGSVVTEAFNLDANTYGTLVLNCSYALTTYTDNDTKSIVIDDIEGFISKHATFKTKSIYPITDDTYYLGKNDDDSPLAWKGVIMKDTTNGKYYRLQIKNGATEIIDLTD